MRTVTSHIMVEDWKDKFEKALIWVNAAIYAYVIGWVLVLVIT